MRQNRKLSNWIQWIIHRHFVVTKFKAKNGFDGIALEFCHTHSSKCVQTIFGGAQNETQQKISAKPTDFVESHNFFSRSVVVVVNLIHFQSKFYDYGCFCRLQFLCMALDLCGKLANPIFVFNSFMRSEPLLYASNRQSDQQHRFSFVNISDAVIEFDEIMVDGEKKICIQMCCGFSFMVF